MVALVRALQRNRANRMCTHREIYFKELAHVLMEAGLFRVVWSLETHTRANAAIRIQRLCLAEVLPAHRRSVFCSSQVSSLLLQQNTTDGVA